MSKKTTKVIAALGVVAGLGIAALPLSSYASNQSIPVTVSVASESGFVTDPNLATCTDMSGTKRPTTDYQAIALSFATPTSASTGTKTSGVCFQSNTTGTYDIKIGSPIGGFDTTALYSEAVTGTEAGATATQKIPAAAVPSFTPGTAGWGYKFTGANRNTAATTGAVAADTTNYVAPIQFTASYAGGGRSLGTGIVIPNGVGDYFGISVDAAVSPAHNGQYSGALVFYATV